MHRLPHLPHADPAPVLRLLRAMMPGVAGVVLAAPDGTPLAHDLPGDPRPVADRALRERDAHATPCAGTLVPWESSLCLVVFLPPGAAEGFSGGPRLPVA